MGTRLLLLIGFAALVARRGPARRAGKGGGAGRARRGRPRVTRSAFATEPGPTTTRKACRLARFIVFPSIELGEVYDTNVFRSETNESDDFITTYSPSIRVGL